MAQKAILYLPPCGAHVLSGPASLVLTYRAHSNGVGQGWVCPGHLEAACGPLLPQAG